MDFMHILGQKEAILNTIFSIFERRRGPQTSRGPGKLSPLSPSLDGPGFGNVLAWVRQGWLGGVVVRASDL